ARAGDWRLSSPSDLHWGDHALSLSLDDGGGALRVSFVQREALALLGRLHVGDFREIPAAWERLAEEMGPAVVEDPAYQWCSLFHSDGMLAEGRSEMRAHLAFVARPGVRKLPGFEPVR